MTCGMMFFMLSVGVHAQDQNREQVLMEDIVRLGERAVRDNVISEEERIGIAGFVRDSLPESTDLKVRALEQIRDELDEQYDQMIREASKRVDEAVYIGMKMLPERLYEPDDYVSPQERRQACEEKAVASAAIDKDKILKHVKPLKMNVHLRSILRFFFGHNVSQRPKRWDQEVVPQMGGVYDIIMPGGRPDDSWRDQPEMVYDPYSDKHFRR